MKSNKRSNSSSTNNYLRHLGDYVSLTPKVFSRTLSVCKQSPCAPRCRYYDIVWWTLTDIITVLSSLWLMPSCFINLGFCLIAVYLLRNIPRGLHSSVGAMFFETWNLCWKKKKPCLSIYLFMSGNVLKIERERSCLSVF